MAVTQAQPGCHPGLATLHTEPRNRASSRRFAESSLPIVRHSIQQLRVGIKERSRLETLGKVFLGLCRRERDCCECRMPPEGDE